MKSTQAKLVSSVLVLVYSLCLASCEKAEEVGGALPVIEESRKGASIEVPEVRITAEELEVVDYEVTSDSPEESVKPIVTSSGADQVSTEIKKNVMQGSFTLTDMSSVKIHPGSDQPKLGDVIYSHTSIPKNACGEYWVQNHEGYVEKLNVCTGDHDHGH